MSDRLRLGGQVVGELMVTAGLVVLLFCFYELTFTGFYTSREQSDLQGQLQQTWAAPARSAPPATTTSGPQQGARPAVAQVPIGAGLAVLWVPRLGVDFARVVVEGVGVEDLKRGPGHLPDSALPGQVGNTVISGHRTTYGAPFEQVDRLRNGDALVVETRDRWFTYRVTGQQVVAPSAVEVTLPVPGRPGVQATAARLTLTTCHPRFSAQQRLIVSALLEGSLAKAGGARPPALTAA